MSFKKEEPYNELPLFLKTLLYMNFSVRNNTQILFQPVQAGNFMHKSCAFANPSAQISEYFVRCVLIMHWPCAYQRLFAQFCLKKEQTGNVQLAMSKWKTYKIAISIQIFIILCIQ
ncbi:MAG: hypothetical protein ACP5DZ_08790 [Bacteroidales bacterium]